MLRDTGKLIAAINTTNATRAATINLTPWCHYKLTAPIVTGSEDGLAGHHRIAVNGNRATIHGTGAVRVSEVDGPGGTCG